jgi:hypothetical protein
MLKKHNALFRSEEGQFGGKKEQQFANGASSSARDLALGEGCFPVKSVPGSSSPSVALGEGFPECFWLFPECIWHSGKRMSPIVAIARSVTGFPSKWPDVPLCQVLMWRHSLRINLISRWKGPNNNLYLVNILQCSNYDHIPCPISKYVFMWKL